MIRTGTLVSRALALALLAAVLAALALLVVLPLAQHWTSLGERRAEAARLAARFHAMAETRDSRAARLAAVSEGMREAGLYLEAESRALAAARMQEMVADTVARHGGEIRSIRVVPGGEEELEAGRVALDVAMLGQWSELFPILHALESGEPQFFVRSFTISAREQRRPGVAEAVPTIQLGFEIYGHLPPEVSG